MAFGRKGKYHWYFFKPSGSFCKKEVIFEEFKGTGNMELQLDRRIANRRIFPAIDLISSSTRRDDLLLDDSTIKRMWVMRKYLTDMNPIEAMEFVSDRIKMTKNNDEFLISMNS